MNNTLDKRIEKVIQKHSIGELTDIVVYQEEDGSFNLFNQYVIRKIDNTHYEVSMITTMTQHVFTKLRNAVAWCTHDKRNQIMDAKRIIELDRHLDGAQTAIDIYSEMAKKAKNIEYKLIYLAKLTEEKSKKRSFSDEMDDFVEKSRIWQIKRFERKPE